MQQTYSSLYRNDMTLDAFEINLECDLSMVLLDIDWNRCPGQFVRILAPVPCRGRCSGGTVSRSELKACSWLRPRLLLLLLLMLQTGSDIQEVQDRPVPDDVRG